MWPISADFKNALKARDREWLAKVTIAGTDYLNDAIVDFEIENSVVSGNDFQIGAAIVSKLTLRLKTTNTIPVNAEVRPYVALRLNNGGQTEWLPLGVFFIDRRQKLQIKDVWEFVCYDNLLRASVPYISQLTYPTGMQNVWNEICSSLGFISDSSVVINPSYTITAGPAGYTKLQVLGYIAAAHAASVYMTREGKIAFRRYGAMDTPVTTLTDADYFRIKETNPKKTYTRVVVVYDTTENLAYEAGGGNENQTLYIENPFATQQMANDLLAQLNGFFYVPVELEARGYPEIDIGDRFRYGRPSDNPDITWAGADVAWQSADFTWDGYVSGDISVALEQKYTFRGGLKMAIQAPGTSQTESEFQIEGSLSQQANRIAQSVAKDAVRFGKTYYGVTHTREQGIVVQRTDNKAKAVFNADELRFEANGQNALWFDIPSAKFKFKGTLEATDGVFTGTIQSGTFQGGTITIGSGNNVFKADSQGIYLGNASFGSAPFRVSMAGALTATSGTIGGWTIQSDRLSGSGIIEGGTITGTTISGGTITGASIFGGTISGGTITGAQIVSNSTINVTTDIRIGNQIIFPGTGMYNTIVCPGVGNLTFNVSYGTVEISAYSGIWMPASKLYFSDLGIGFLAMMNSKANKNVATSTVGDHNHGIPPGTQLLVAGGGTVTWQASGAHSHIQN